MRWRRWLLVVAGYLFVLAFVGLSAAAGWFYWERVQTRGEEATRAVLPGLATKEIPEGLRLRLIRRSNAVSARRIRC